MEKKARNMYKKQKFSYVDVERSYTYRILLCVGSSNFTDPDIKHGDTCVIT
jgi:hypothetical protein